MGKQTEHLYILDLSFNLFKEAVESRDSERIKAAIELVLMDQGGLYSETDIMPYGPAARRILNKAYAVLISRMGSEWGEPTERAEQPI